MGNCIALGETPLIAVSTGFTDYGDYVGVAYSRPLLRAGAQAVLLPYLEDAAERERVLDRVDALLLGFGRDIDPRRYLADPHPSLTELAPHRDEIELALVREAIDRGLPLLGICRGLQILNVALGGSLYLDKSKYPLGAREHPGGDWERWQLVCEAELGFGEMPAHPEHAIDIQPGSLLAAALGTHAVVNSYHHQAVRVLGEGLVVTARSPEGIIEAVELPSAPGYVLAVQWELQQSWQTDDRFLDVFRDFVAAAARTARDRATA